MRLPIPQSLAAALLTPLAIAACATGPDSVRQARGGLPPETVWADEMADGSGVTAIGIGPDGSVYAAGWTSAALSEGAGLGGRDAFVRRYSADGEITWTRQFGAAGDDNAEDIAIDAAGNVYVAARVDGPVGAGPSGGRDGHVAAFGPGGTPLWSLRLGTDAVDWADSVAVLDDGRIVVSGSTSGAFPGHSNRGSSDNFLAVIDVGGDLVTLTQFGSEEGMGATALAAHGGRLYMAGSTLGPLSASPTGEEHAGSADVFVRIFDPDGADLRTWTFGSNHADSALDVLADDLGIVIVGTTRAVLPNPVVGIGSRSGGFLDAFAIGLSPDLQITWVDQFGTSEWDVASAVAQGDDRALYVAGRTNGSFPGQAARGGYDAFVRAMDRGGGTGWTRQLGSATDDRAQAVAVAPGGDVLLGGVGGVAGDGSSEPERGWVIRIRPTAR